MLPVGAARLEDQLPHTGLDARAVVVDGDADEPGPGRDDADAHVPGDPHGVLDDRRRARARPGPRASPAAGVRHVDHDLDRRGVDVGDSVEGVRRGRRPRRRRPGSSPTGRARAGLVIVSAIRRVPARISSTSAPQLVVEVGAQRDQVGRALHGGQRGAQLVGQLGGEPLLGADRRRHLVEQRVEGAAERGDLVGRRAEVETAVEVVLAPLRPRWWPSSTTGASARRLTQAASAADASTASSPGADADQQRVVLGLLVGRGPLDDHDHARGPRWRG